MREMGLKDVQKASLAILEAFDRFCLERGLTYWIMYGTLIGQVRHGGYIPWDDDVDVTMPRKDYEELLRIFREERPADFPYELHTYEDTEGYPYYISRLADTTHELIFHSNHYRSGVFIDIYPFDGMGNDIDYWKGEWKKICRIRKFITLGTSKTIFYGNSLAHKAGNFPLSLYARARGMRHFFRKLDSIERQFEGKESRYMSLPVWDSKLYSLEKEWFDEVIRAPFEDITVNIPKRYDEILRAIYGDYMELPPEKDRAPQHNFTAYFKYEE